MTYLVEVRTHEKAAASWIEVEAVRSDKARQAVMKLYRLSGKLVGVAVPMLMEF